MNNAALPTTALGRTGMEVTRLGYGTSMRRPVSKEHAGTLLTMCLNSGINFLDSAHDYTRYVISESMIGHHLSDRASDFFVATKCGCTDNRPDQNYSDHIWSRQNLLEGLEISLGRLRTDSIDVMQLHNPTVEECERGGLIETLEDMRQMGKVKWIGVSTTLPHLPTFLDWGIFDTFQIPYSAVEREHEDWITKVGESGAGVIIRGGVGWGEPGAGLGDENRWARFHDAKLDEFRDEGESWSAFVLRYTLTHKHVHTVIAATTNLEHMQENVDAASKGGLPNDVYVEIKRRLDDTTERPAPVD